MTGLTVYLGKQQVAHPHELLQKIDQMDHVLVSVGEETIGELFIRKRRPQPPSWATFFSGSNIDPGSLGSTQSAGATLLLNVDDRFFAVTFGTGHHSLRRDMIEDRFGLLVAVNSIDKHRLRSLDKSTFDAISKKSREQAIREAETREFGLDTEQDLLLGVTETPSDPRLGNRLTGKEALRATGSFDLATLRGQLSRYLDRFHDTVYRDKFPWVDNIREVKDRLMQEELDLLLQKTIESENWANLWLAAPDIVDWERTAGFSYRFGRNPTVIYDMHMKTVAEQLGRTPLTVDNLRRRYVQSLGVDDSLLERWPLYRCLHAELEHQGNVYLLSSGRWFQAAIDFVGHVDRAIKDIPLIDLGLPPFDDELEGDYNERVASSYPELFSLMHGELVLYGGGRSRIEACDLYGLSGDFIHVKRYAGSSDLSKLFAQGVVAGEIFARDRDFRRSVSDLLPEPFRAPEIGSFLPRNEFRVVFAVISRSGRELRLPFFARLNLKRAQEILVSLGYEVALTDVPVSEMRRLVKRSLKASKTF